jgi:hypothetical protein
VCGTKIAHPQSRQPCRLAFLDGALNGAHKQVLVLQEVDAQEARHAVQVLQGKGTAEAGNKRWAMGRWSTQARKCCALLCCIVIIMLLLLAANPTNRPTDRPTVQPAAS